MNRLMKLRLALLTIIVWSSGAWIAWTAPIPDAALVGQKQARTAATQPGDFSRPELDEARKVLEDAQLWGTQRDGKPFPPPPDKEKAKKKVDWQLLGQAIRPKERYILIRVAADAPVAVKEGEALPDGGRLLKIAPQMITIQTAEGDKRRIPTFSE